MQKQARSSGLGQTAIGGANASVKFRIVDPSGSPVRDKKFYFDFLPDQKYQPGAASDARNEEHFSSSTDQNGVANVSVWRTTGGGENGLRYLVSITPLFESSSAPKDKAIVWQLPVRFDPAGNTTMTIVNVPGGGFDSGANVVAPKPPPKMVLAPDGTFVPAPETGEFPVWAWVALGLGTVVVAYFFVLPAIFGKDDE